MASKSTQTPAQKAADSKDRVLVTHKDTKAVARIAARSAPVWEAAGWHLGGKAEDLKSMTGSPRSTEPETTPTPNA